MFKQPRCIQNSINIIFPRQSNIRRKANEFEDKLQGHYFQPQIFPVPDDLDPEVPRMIFGSKHGFSQIIVSQISFALNVNYSPDWQTDREKRKDYLIRRIPTLFQLLGISGISDPCFCGLTTQFRLVGKDVSDEDIIVHLARLYLKDESVQNYHDLQIKKTEVLEDKFFSNVTVKNYRSWKFQGTIPGILRLARTDANERGIEIIVDFNDRYIFNENNSYYTNEDTAAIIIQNGMNETDKIVDHIGSAIQ
jgi:hypothetical protein